MPDIRTYDGADIDGFIAGHSNPWVEVDGQPVDWMTSSLPRTPCPCDDQGAVIVPGVLDAMDSPMGVQRCDSCDTYPGDLDAALALARLVGGVVKYHHADF